MIHEETNIISKLCFAIGGLPFMICVNSLGLFITPFLLEQAQLRPIQLSIILFTAKGWDALTDPLVGYLVSKTNTRWGKFRPWILVSTPFVMITYMMIWYVPDLTLNQKTVWYLVSYCLFQLFSTCHRVPYLSLTMSLTQSQIERDKLTGYRMIFEISAVLLAAVIQGTMITIYGGNTTCENSTSFLNSSYSNQSIIITPNHVYSKLSEGFFLTAGIVSALYLLISCATFFGTKEINDVKKTKDKNFLSALKLAFSQKSHRTLLLAFLFYSLAVQTLQTNISLYLKYVINAKSVYQYILVIVLISSILSLPILKKLIFRIGKKMTYASGALVLIPALSTLMFITELEWYIYLISCAFGYGIAANMLLSWSMIPDVIDEFMILTGERHESIFYSFFVFFNKITDGVSIAGTNAILEYGGFIECPSGCCHQPISLSKVLRYLVSPCPILALTISLFFIWKHSIGEKKLKENNEILAQRRENQFIIVRL